jgi:uncharacterized protein (DUF983 family)
VGAVAGHDEQLPSPARERALSKKRLLWRGMTKRCARCGSGRLFRRWFTMVDRCPRCDLDFNREPGWVLGAMTINTVFMFIAIFATMFTGFVLTYPDIAVARVSIATVLAGTAAALIGYPFSKTVWIAIDLMMVPDLDQLDADAHGDEDGPPATSRPQGSRGAGPTRSSSRST